MSGIRSPLRLSSSSASWLITASITGLPSLDRVIADLCQYVERLDSHGPECKEIEVGKRIQEDLRGPSLPIEPIRRGSQNATTIVTGMKDKPTDDQCQPFDAGDLVVGRGDQVAESHRRQRRANVEAAHQRPAPGAPAAASRKVLC